MRSVSWRWYTPMPVVSGGAGMHRDLALGPKWSWVFLSESGEKLTNKKVPVSSSRVVTLTYAECCLALLLLFVGATHL